MLTAVLKCHGPTAEIIGCLTLITNLTMYLNVLPLVCAGVLHAYKFVIALVNVSKFGFSLHETAWKIISVCGNKQSKASNYCARQLGVGVASGQ